jgi:transposase
MNKPTILKTERVDDRPLLLAQLERMGVQELIDQHFPTHGNWQGLNLGQVAIVWLSHILSQADHRMNQVQSWAEQRIESLGILVGQEVRGLDLRDDRLESVVFNLSKDESWNSFEQDLSQRQLQVYDLKPERVRLDSTSVSGFWDKKKEGLFRYGHSKDHRPDLPQMKLMMATLDSLGVPIASEIVAGNSADDPLYQPAIAQVRKHWVRGECYMSETAKWEVLAQGISFKLVVIITYVRYQKLKLKQTN